MKMPSLWPLYARTHMHACAQQMAREMAQQLMALARSPTTRICSPEPMSWKWQTYSRKMSWTSVTETRHASMHLAGPS